MQFRLVIIRITRRLRARRSLGFAAVGAVMVASVLMNAGAFWLFDRNAQGDEPLGFGEAIWYSVVSITTIGYGDYSAVTPGARVATVVFIVLVGLSAFSVFFGMIVDGVNELASRTNRGLGRAMASDHVLIVHFPSEARVRQLIDELRADREHAADEIVIVSDQIAELPFKIEGVMFVRGGTHDAETYRRASAGQARLAIVLSRDYADPNSDAVVAAAVSVIESVADEASGPGVGPNRIHTVAECLHERHRALFKSVRCDAVVSGLKMAGNLLVQELHDPGVSRVIEVLTSNRVGDTLFSTPVPAGSSEGAVGYTELALALLGLGGNMLAVTRGDDAITTFAGERSRAGDRVVYVGERRLSWDELVAAATR